MELEFTDFDAFTDTLRKIARKHGKMGKGDIRRDGLVFFGTELACSYILRKKKNKDDQGNLVTATFTPKYSPQMEAV